TPIYTFLSPLVTTQPIFSHWARTFALYASTSGDFSPIYFTLSVSQYNALSHPTILIICHRQRRVMLLAQSPHKNANFFSWVFATSSGVIGSRYLTSRPVSLCSCTRLSGTPFSFSCQLYRSFTIPASVTAEMYSSRIVF